MVNEPSVFEPLKFDLFNLSLWKSANAMPICKGGKASLDGPVIGNYQARLTDKLCLQNV